MSTEDNALPTGDDAAASATSTEQDHVAATDAEQQVDQAAGEGKEQEAKKEKTPEQREIDRLRRRVDNLTRQKYELRAAMPAPAPQQHQSQADDDEPVTLTRAELQRQIAEQAQKLAPTMKEQQAEAERRHGVVTLLAKEWGQEKFDNLSAELDDAFGGLMDHRGAPKAATDAIFEADSPKDVIEYLTDPDNADEAASFSKMNALQAGREIARIEQKIEAAKLDAKPRPSNAPAPIEPARGGGVKVEKDPAQMTDAEFAAWRRRQIAQRNK